MKRRLRLFVIPFLAGALLAGCGSRVGYERHRTPDGRDIECFVYHAGLKSGISCNWPGEKP